MLKHTLLSLGLTLTLFGLDKPLADVTPQYGIIDASNIQKGMSGIVIHRFDDNRSSIVAKAIVSEIKDNSALITWDVFDDLSQEALPRITRLPQKGDIVRLTNMYERVSVIAPNLTTYQDIILTHKDLTFIHPDQFAFYLSTKRTPLPQKEDFTNACKNLSISRLFIPLAESLIEVDCGSMKVLNTQSYKRSDNNASSPFYNRIGEIEKPFWSFFRNFKIDNFDIYYKKLLGIKHD